MRSLILFVFILYAILMMTGCEKYELDRQMAELCKKDGGVRVYEKVKLPPEMFDINGDPFPGWPDRSVENRLGSDYKFVDDFTYIKKGDSVKGAGSLFRFHWRIVRNIDLKVLGEGVAYGRSGGDFIMLGHPSASGCPLQLGSGSVIHSVFIK